MRRDANGRNKIARLRLIISKWNNRAENERKLLVEAFLLLAVARLAILILPFRWLAVTLGKRLAESDSTISQEDVQNACMIGRAVSAAARNTPWESVCLPQAVAAQWMLKRRHIAGTLYLGVAKNETGPEKLTAHAWLQCGDAILTGADNHRQFTVIATFS
jgi:hypothetical protein